MAEKKRTALNAIAKAHGLNPVRTRSIDPLWVEEYYTQQFEYFRNFPLTEWQLNNPPPLVNESYAPTTVASPRRNTRDFELFPVSAHFI